MVDLAAAAVDAGHGADGWARVVELLRKPPHAGRRADRRQPDSSVMS